MSICFLMRVSLENKKKQSESGPRTHLLIPNARKIKAAIPRKSKEDYTGRSKELFGYSRVQPRPRNLLQVADYKVTGFATSSSYSYSTQYKKWQGYVFIDLVFYMGGSTNITVPSFAPIMFKKLKSIEKWTIPSKTTSSRG